MINHTDIENVIGCKTLVTDRMQQAIEGWYDVAIDGLPLNRNPETLTLGLPSLICSELARLTTLELEVKVEGSPRADWINTQLQRVISPRKRRILAVALALGSGVWKPYQSGNKLGISFSNAACYFPVSHDIEGSLTEGVFIDTIQDNGGYYHRLEWLHVLENRRDLRDEELAQLEDNDLDAPAQFPCVKVVNMAFRSSTQDSLGSPDELSIRPEWDEIQPVAYLSGLEKLPVGYFVTPIVNSVDPGSELGAAMFEPARVQIIDAEEQYTRLDWEYEAAEMAIDVPDTYLKPGSAGEDLSRAQALKLYGVPPEGIPGTAPHHRERLFHGMNVNTGITQNAPFYQVFAPALRDTSYLTGLNQYLRNVESHAGLSFGVISQVADVEKTATEIVSSRQKLYATVSDLQAALEDALRGLIDALDYWGDHVKGAPGRGKLNIAFHWDDSIILDRITEMDQWRQDVSMGLRGKAEYRQHFFGEDEETAAQAIREIQTESAATDILQGVIDNGDG